MECPHNSQNKRVCVCVFIPEEQEGHPESWTAEHDTHMCLNLEWLDKINTHTHTHTHTHSPLT